MTNFRLALPIVHVNSLDEGTEFVESHGFCDLRDLVLDSIRETIVKVVLKGTFFITPDLQSNLVESNNIFVDVLTILHGQMVQLVFCISDQVMWSKVGLEFQDELLEVIHPGRVYYMSRQTYVKVKGFYLL